MSRDIEITITQPNPFDFGLEQNSTIKDLEVGIITGATGMVQVYSSEDFDGTGNEDNPLSLSNKFYEKLDEKIDQAVEQKTQTYIHEQSVASTLWTIEHNLHKFPDVQVVDSAGTVVTCKRRYIDENTVTIEINAPFKGKAYLN